MEQKPFTWVVAFTVAPLWIADGFSLSDDRALDMLARELDFADIGSELGATVLSAPSATAIAREQGYGKAVVGAAAIVDELRSGTPNDKKLHDALASAIRLLDSVVFVAKAGDTAKPLALLREALDLVENGVSAECSSSV